MTTNYTDSTNKAYTNLIAKATVVHIENHICFELILSTQLSLFLKKITNMKIFI